VQHNSEEQALILTLAEITKAVAARKVDDTPSANQLFGNSVAKTFDEMSAKPAAGEAGCSSQIPNSAGIDGNTTVITRRILQTVGARYTGFYYGCNEL